MAVTVAGLPRGRALLRDSRHNRGTAFTLEQRAALGLEGLLPAGVSTLEEQARRTFEQYRAQPTDLARNDVIGWTDGRGLVATGTPWDPVPYRGVEYAVGQANNALVYPGIGLGTIVSRASRVTDGMLLAAAGAVAALVDVHQPGAGLLPDVENLRATSAAVAVAVARQAATDGVAGARLDDPVQSVQDAMWQPVYPELGSR